MTYAVKRHSINFGGRKTSISLEDEFWNALKMIAESENIRVADLIGRIKKKGKTENVSSAIRIFVFTYMTVAKKRRGASRKRRRVSAG